MKLPRPEQLAFAWFFLIAAAARAQTVPSFAPGGVVNAATYEAGTPLAPGSLVAVFGSFGLAGSLLATTLPLPTNLSGLSAHFDNFAAPLLYVSPGQVNLQVPWELVPRTQSALTVTVNGQTSSPVTIRLAPFAPGLFSINSQGSGQGAILDTANRLLDASLPAIPGSTIAAIYSTALGPVTNQPLSGAAAPAGPLAETTGTPTVTIGGVPALVLFAGLAPGLVGVYQINVLVPAGVPSGNDVPVRISIGGFGSNSVTLPVAAGGSLSGPLITSLSPASVVAGTASQVIVVNGTNFTPDSTLTLNGISRATAFTDSGHLAFSLGAADLAVPGAFPVVVLNGSGDASQPVNLVVTPAPSPAWQGFGRDAQHTARAPAASQPLNRIKWQAPVDLAPQFSGGELLIHYGSPLITAAGTLVIPVKTGAGGSFRVDARNSADGSLLWQLASGYVLPPSAWTPEFGPALAVPSRVYVPGIAGKVSFRDSADSAAGATGEIAFYGLANYLQDSQAYDAGVFINTPITADPAGNIYFGFLVTGPTPLQLASGIARIGFDGHGTWMPVTTAAADATMTQVVYNCAPALSADSSTLYVAVSNGDIYQGAGYLVALDSQTLAPLTRIRLKDPESGQDALLSNNGTASPTVGPDGDVYFGVLENPEHQNHDRGWLLHFDSFLSQSKTPGAFGWDEAVSPVPASMVPSYTGASAYLLMTKYNDYGGSGLPPLYRIAVVDPAATETDPITAVTVMKEVLTIAGAAEWCINSVAVDPATKSVLAGSEDGRLYRWDLAGNALSQSLVLSSGIAEAYTPTLVGPDGTVYAINNATLFAVGQ